MENFATEVYFDIRGAQGDSSNPSDPAQNAPNPGGKGARITGIIDVGGYESLYFINQEGPSRGLGTGSGGRGGYAAHLIFEAGGDSPYWGSENTVALAGGGGGGGLIEAGGDANISNPTAHHADIDQENLVTPTRPTNVTNAGGAGTGWDKNQPIDFFPDGFNENGDGGPGGKSYVSFNGPEEHEAFNQLVKSYSISLNDDSKGSIYLEFGPEKPTITGTQQINKSGNMTVSGTGTNTQGYQSKIQIFSKSDHSLLGESDYSNTLRNWSVTITLFSTSDFEIYAKQTSANGVSNTSDFKSISGIVASQPTVSITPTPDRLGIGQVANVKFDLSDPPGFATSFTFDDITVSDGTLTNFTPVGTPTTRNVIVGLGNGDNGDNTLAYSLDGRIWHGLGKTIFSKAGSRAASNDYMFAAVGEGTNSLAVSDDGVNWTPKTLHDGKSFAKGNGVVWIEKGAGAAWHGNFEGRFIAVGERRLEGGNYVGYPLAYTTLDSNGRVSGWWGVNVGDWVAGSAIAASPEGHVIALGVLPEQTTAPNVYTSLYSPNGDTWFFLNGTGLTHQEDLVYGVGDDGVGRYVAVGHGGVASGAKYFIGPGQGDDYWWAKPWYNTTGLPDGAGHGVAFGGMHASQRRFVAVGKWLSNSIYYSSDGISWTPAAQQHQNIFDTGRGVNWTGSIFVATGDAKTTGASIAYSRDGINWTKAETTSVNFSTKGLGVASQSYSVYTEYTAEFQPAGDKSGTAAITVPANSFKNFGNLQNGQASASIDFDTRPLNVTISADRSPLKSGETSNITFALSVAAGTSNPFVKEDIQVSGGSLSVLTQSENTYTAVFTPLENSTTNGVLTIAAGGFESDFGNSNTVASLTIPVDTVIPTITITSNRPRLKAGETATITYELSKPTTQPLEIADINVTGGRNDFFTGSGTLYTSVFTPNTNIASNAILSVQQGVLTDQSGNLNSSANLQIPIDTKFPTVNISSSKPKLSKGESAIITFTLSETPGSGTSFTMDDVTVEHGSLSGFAKDSSDNKRYTATYTPNSGINSTGVVSVNEGKFKDDFGNTNTESNLQIPIDTISPSVLMTSSHNDGSQTSTITFTLSEAPGSGTSFTMDDVTVVDGSLSAFAQDSSNTKIYTATLTPDADSAEHEAEITVPEGSFKDSFGNTNTPATHHCHIDTSHPTVSITSDPSQVKANQTATITFTLSESPGSGTSFTIDDDITVQKGALSSFREDTDDDKIYTATFTPNTDVIGDAVIDIPDGAFKDDHVNPNLKESLVIPIDTVIPGVSISAHPVSGLRYNQTSNITFVLTKTPASGTSFDSSDITVSGGTLGSFSGTGTVYTAVFTPDSNSSSNGVISISQGAYSDSFGNQSSDSSKTISDINTVRPSITSISSNTNQVKAGETATITLVTSEATDDFNSSFVSVSNGTLGSFTISDNKKEFTAVFTPAENTNGNGVISVPKEIFTSSESGNPNTASNSYIVTVMTVIPTIKITSNKDKLLAGQTAKITFELSEQSDDFVKEDITVQGGSIPAFSESDKNYTATFVPNPNSTSDGIIQVSSDKFRNNEGNFNKDGSDDNNTVTIQINTKLPTMTIASNSSTTKEPSILLTFISNEETDDFTPDDISVNGNATISNFQPNALDKKHYSCFLEFSQSGTYTVDVTVNANKFTGSSGNLNSKSNTLTINFDNEKPPLSFSEPITTKRYAYGGTKDQISTQLTAKINNPESLDLQLEVEPYSSSTLSIGSYTFTYTIVDSADNSSSLEIPVDVVPLTPVLSRSCLVGTITNYDDNNIYTITPNPVIALKGASFKGEWGKTYTITATRNGVTSDLGSMEIPQVVYPHSCGDPYIQSANGKITKIPDKHGFYRMFQYSDIFINAEVDYLNIGNELKNFLEMIGCGFKSKDGKLPVSKGYWTKSIFIQSEGHSFSFNMFDAVLVKTSDYFNLEKNNEDRRVVREMSLDDDIKESIIVSWEHSLLGRQEVVLDWYHNPQVQNGVSLRSPLIHDKQSLGMFIKNYKAKYMEIQSLETCKWKKFERRLKAAKNAKKKLTHETPIKSESEDWYVWNRKELIKN